MGAAKKFKIDDVKEISTPMHLTTYLGLNKD